MGTPRGLPARDIAGDIARDIANRPVFTDFYRFLGLSWEASTFNLLPP